MTRDLALVVAFIATAIAALGSLPERAADFPTYGAPAGHCRWLFPC